MSTKDLRALMHHYVEECNKGKAAAIAIIDETCAPDIVVRSGIGIHMNSIESFKQSMSEFYDAFPDSHMTIDDMVVEGDKVAVRYTLTGTQTGEYMGIPPTNKKANIWVLETNRVVNGKFVETWTTFDTLGFMQQLGLAPTPGK